MEMTQRHDLIEELHNLDFEDGPLDNTGWRLKRYADGASVWFNAAGQFILRMPTENYSGLASEPKHILDLIAAHFQE